MATTLEALFRNLTSFAPVRMAARDADWETFVEWVIANGLAPLVAYNLEYRTAGAGAPEWARDRLLSIYQGSANDNVMKLVNFKRSLSDLEGRTIVVLSGASYAESVYPHVAFRPILDISMVVPPRDVGPLSAYLRRAEFKPAEKGEAVMPADEVLSDGRTALALYGSILGNAAEDAALLQRALPLKVYGPSMYRLDLEDAILTDSLLMARAGFQVPLIQLIDLRELVTGSSAMGGVYSRVVKAEVLLARAAALKCERALWATLMMVQTLFPDTEGSVQPLLPSIALPTRELLTRLVVNPVATVGRLRSFVGEESLRQLLLGA